MWTPRFRWTPEHSMQTRTPRFKDAQSGSGAPQSAHLSLPHTFCNMSMGFSILTQDRCCCKFLDKRSRWEEAGCLSAVYSSAALWSKSELSKELLSLAEWWWLPPKGPAERHWKIIGCHIFRQRNKEASRCNSLAITLSGAWELSNEAITPVIFSIQSIWSNALSACTDQLNNNCKVLFTKSNSNYVQNDKLFETIIKKKTTARCRKRTPAKCNILMVK